MSDHIRFQETRLGLISLLEDANGDLLLEQGSGTRRRKTTRTLCSRPTTLPSDKSRKLRGGGKSCNQKRKALHMSANACLQRGTCTFPSGRSSDGV